MFENLDLNVGAWRNPDERPLRSSTHTSSGIVIVVFLVMLFLIVFLVIPHVQNLALRLGPKIVSYCEEGRITGNTTEHMIRIGDINLIAEVLSSQEVAFTLEFTSIGGIWGKNVTIFFRLDPGLQPLDIPRSLQVELERGQSAILKMTARAMSDGEWLVTGIAVSRYEQESLAVQATLMIKVSNGIITGVKPLP